MSDESSLRAVREVKQIWLQVTL